MARALARWSVVACLVVAALVPEAQCGFSKDRALSDTAMDFEHYYQWRVSKSGCSTLFKSLGGHEESLAVVQAVFDGVKCKGRVQWSWFGRELMCFHHNSEADFRFLCLGAKDGKTIVRYISDSASAAVVSMITGPGSMSITGVHEAAGRGALVPASMGVPEEAVSSAGLPPADAVLTLQYLCGFREAFLTFVAKDELREYKAKVAEAQFRRAASNYMADGYKSMNDVLRGRAGCRQYGEDVTYIDCSLSHPVQKILTLQAGLNGYQRRYTMHGDASVRWGQLVSNEKLSSIRKAAARPGRNLVLRYSTSEYERRIFDYHQKTGEPWVSSSFLSTSKSLDPGGLWKALGPLFVGRFDTEEGRQEVFWNTVLWVIDSKTGVDTDDTGGAGMAGEQEVLFPAMTKFDLKDFVNVKYDENLEHSIVKSRAYGMKFFQSLPSISYVAFLEEV